MVHFAVGKKSGLLLGALLLSQAGKAQATIQLTGLDAAPRTLTATELARLPRQTQTATDKEGNAHRYEGVALAEVLKLMDAPQGKALHGAALSQAVLVTGKDGYRVVYALPELDATFASHTVLLADRRDGQPLPAESGPYQVIMPQEKRPARWVRQVVKVQLVQVKP